MARIFARIIDFVGLGGEIHEVGCSSGRLEFCD